MLLIFTNCRNQQFSVVGMQCEYLDTPIGIDEHAPRFTWQIEGVLEDTTAISFQLLMDTDKNTLKIGENVFWNSGILKDNKQLMIYEGDDLKPFTKYYWRVLIFNQLGRQIAVSPVAHFETGMMNTSNWQGKWISDGESVEYRPASYFRKDFELNKKIETVRAYITAAGLYELSVNGEKVSDEMLNPMYTRFDRRNLYSTFDISSFLTKGQNVVGVELGNGWYNHQSTAVWFFDKAAWRNRPAFMLNIRVKYADGTSEVIATDSFWKRTNSPVIFNSIYTAEHYDGRLEIPGWNTSKVDDSDWNNTVETQAPSPVVVSQQLRPIRVSSVLKPTEMRKINDSNYVFTFPGNIAGVIDLKVKGKKGTVLRIAHAELLDKVGLPDLSNIDYHFRPTDDSDPFQTDIFILSGGNDHFSPKFNYKGFQYVGISASEPIELKADNIRALEMHSDVPQKGFISSSNPTLNKIWEATNSSYLANLFGYPTDCPQREKNGWTGDAHIAIETALYNFDAITIYEKWMNDFKDEQRANGVLPCIIPTSIWGYDWANGVDWTSAIAIIPWEVYRFYGDDRLLRRMYDNIKSYVDYITSISPDRLTDWGLGDWIPVQSESNKKLTSSLYYYTDVVILSKAASLFGKQQDAQYYTQLADEIKTAINENFLNESTGIYCSGTQTELSTALYWGVVPEELKAKVAKNLYVKVAANDFHLDVGLLGTKALLNALSENGYAEAAYRVATQETYPSWGHWIKNGATTLFENWKVDVTKDASRNHIMFGEIGAWFYKGIGGLFPDEKYPGFKYFVLKPHFIDSLDHFEMKHRSPYGWISSSWKRKGNRIIYELHIPVNSSATLYLPANNEQSSPLNLKAGNHTITFTISNNN
jgi:alpha-L-rhamnosidase